MKSGGVLDLFRIEGRTAVVTGGGRGLGEAIAEALAEAGANLVLCSRRVEDCEAVAGRLRDGGAEAIAVRCDVSDAGEIENVVSVASDTFGGIDILVNNSGVTWGAPPEEMPPDKIDRVMDVNVRGTFLMAAAAARRMIEQGRGGAIVNVASVLAFMGSTPGRVEAAGYHASKGAVVSLTRALAGSWARHGIRVNAIAPGWFPTKMSRGALESSGDAILARIPLERFGAPSDLKGTALLLVSPAGAYITGQTVVVDGGLLVG